MFPNVRTCTRDLRRLGHCCKTRDQVTALAGAQDRILTAGVVSKTTMEGSLATEMKFVVRPVVNLKGVA